MNPARAPEPVDPLASLLARIAAGDESAMGRLYDATSARVFGTALHLLRDRTVAEEATLDAYLQVWKTAGTWDPHRGGVLGWLLTIARTRAIDLLRARARRTAREVALPESRSGEERLDPAPGPEQSVRAGETAEAVRLALATLPREQRQALEAAYFGGLSHTEVAESLGVPLGTAKTRIRDGLAALRRALDADRGDFS